MKRRTFLKSSLAMGFSLPISQAFPVEVEKIRKESLVQSPSPSKPDLN